MSKIENEAIEEDATYMVEFVKRVCTEVGPGGPCTPEEHQRGEIVKEEMEAIGIAESVTLEEFTCSPRAFLGWIRCAIGLMALAIILFFLSPLSPVILTLIPLAIGILVIVIIWEEFFSYKEFIDPLFKKRKSFNVIGRVTNRVGGGTEPKKILLFAGHHDSAFQFNLLQYLKVGYFIVMFAGLGAIFWFTILSAVRFVGVLAVGESLWAYQSAIRTLYWAVPVMALLFFFQGSAKNGGRVPGATDNLSAVAVVLGLGRVLKRHPEIIPEGVEVRLVSFGCEEAGLRGAYRYAERHLEELKKSDAELFNMDTLVNPDEQTIFTREDTTRTKHSPEVIAKMLKAAERAGVRAKASPMPFVGGGTDAAAFSKAGIKAANIFSLPYMDYLRFYHQSRDTWDKINPKTQLNVLKMAVEYVKMALE